MATVYPMRKPLILTQTVQFTPLKVLAWKRRETLKTTLRALIVTLESEVSYFLACARLSDGIVGTY